MATIEEIVRKFPNGSGDVDLAASYTGAKGRALEDG